MVRQSSLSYFCGRNQNTLAPYREIFINFFLFSLLFPYLFLSPDSVQGDALPGLLLQLDSFSFFSIPLLPLPRKGEQVAVGTAVAVGAGRGEWEVCPGAVGGPGRGHLRGLNKPPCCGCRAATGRAFCPAWTLHPAWSRGHGSCLQRHLLLSFRKLLLHFILIPTSGCCSVWGFGPCVLRSASSPAPTSPSWSDYVDNNV